MAYRSPVELPVEQTALYLKSVLPPTPCRVLEVGCGSGEVAEQLMKLGYAVVGVDNEPESIATARTRGVEAVEANFLTWHTGNPFDVVLFCRSLHHVDALPEVAEQAHRLLKPGGLVIGEEFAVERMDPDTARWYYELLSLLETTGTIPPDTEHEPLAANQLDRWFEEHDADGPVHTGEDMMVALGSRFRISRAENAPYLYRYLCERVPATAQGARVANWMFEVESMRVRQATLQPLGLRLVAVRDR